LLASEDEGPTVASALKSPPRLIAHGSPTAPVRGSPGSRIWREEKLADRYIKNVSDIPKTLIGDAFPAPFNANDHVPA
jgi:hypothetical protein